MFNSPIAALQSKLGHDFTNARLLLCALTHKSFDARQSESPDSQTSTIRAHRAYESDLREFIALTGHRHKDFQSSCQSPASSMRTRFSSCWTLLVIAQRDG